MNKSGIKIKQRATPINMLVESSLIRYLKIMITVVGTDQKYLT